MTVTTADYAVVFEPKELILLINALEHYLAMKPNPDVENLRLNLGHLLTLRNLQPQI